MFDLNPFHQESVLQPNKLLQIRLKLFRRDQVTDVIVTSYHYAARVPFWPVV